MTRKDFEAIAKTLKEIPYQAFASPWGYRRIVTAFAEMCRQSNPRFKESKFYIACGIKERD